ncbi:MAG: class I SAM-dependent methyltransferase [Synergistaceae bacterium]|nr:class I SAM-dependent methyltransferase [Synergistaceae bacterium]
MSKTATLSNHEPRTTNHEPPRFVTKISDGEQVDLSLLNEKQLLQLHYDEEICAVSRLLKMAPFSEDRKILLNKGYYLVETIQKWYVPQTGANGASSYSVDLVCRFLKDGSKNNTALYEAGVGSGFSSGQFLKYPGVSVRGCDVVLQPSVIELMRQYPDRITVEENTLYDSLKGLDDESIDIFYADNVFEHMFPDEFPEIMKLLTAKLKHGALLFLFIPNRLCGPHDVSKNFLKMGQRATGFHTMEQSYRDVTECFRCYGIVPAYFTYRTVFKNYGCIKDSSGRLNKFKLCLEGAAKFLPCAVRRNAMELLGLSSYILAKE